MIERRGRGYSTHSTRDPVSPSRQSFAAVPNSSGLAASCTYPVWAQRTRVLFADAAKREERGSPHTPQEPLKGAPSFTAPRKIGGRELSPDSNRTATRTHTRFPPRTTQPTRVTPYRMMRMPSATPAPLEEKNARSGVGCSNHRDRWAWAGGVWDVGGRAMCVSNDASCPEVGRLREHVSMRRGVIVL